MPSVAASRDGVHVFWSVTLESHIVGLRWSADRRTVVAGGIEGEVGIIDVATGDFIRRWRAHTFGLASVALSPDGEHIATCGHDGAMRIWNVVDGSLAAECELSDRWGIRAEYSPSGRCIGIAAGKAVTICDANGALVRALPAGKNTVSDIGWKPQTKAGDPEVLASSGYGGVHLWRADLDARAKFFSWRGSSLVLAWSPDGRYIATGDQDCTVHFWIVAKGKDLEMSGYPIKVQELAWSADSRFLATGGSADVTIWNCSGRGPRGTEPIVCEGHEDKITALAFSQAGILASAAADGDVRMWLPHLDTTSRAKFAAPDVVSTMAWSADAALLAIGTTGGEVLCCASEIA